MINEQPRIRPCEASDIEAVAAIYAQSVANGVATYELVPPTVGEMLSRFETITGSGYPWFAAEIDGEVVGYAYGSAFRARPAYRFLVEDSIYLDSAWQGRGVGRLLLTRLLVDCEAHGFRQMLAVIGGAEPGSIALHRRLGFEACGTIRASGYKFGRWLDTVLMQKSLGAGAGSLPE